MHRLNYLSFKNNIFSIKNIIFDIGKNGTQKSIPCG